MANVSEVSLLEQLVRFGYFPEQLPPCFVSDSLFSNFCSLVPIRVNKSSECTTFTLSKKAGGRRIMHIPNPEHQVKLINYIIENHVEIKDFCCSSKHSLSNPFQGENSSYNASFLDIPRL